ncbi:hypothetical protein PoMZ_12931 [Pyricularia oryzae]|uniref:Uncharacterized protein n=1 Tax=Pyricularia oryzae TaxID=318829 RepID=A0A4P7NTU5_PYROR|nr:hypothetical protein PoMZ_12931 [Pyricularia oryzae]
MTAKTISLEQGRQAPGPVTLDLEGTKGGPGGDEGADGIRAAHEGGDDSSVLRKGDLGAEKRACVGGEGHAGTNDEAGGQEGIVVGSTGLQNNTDDGHNTANDDTLFPSKSVANPRNRSHGYQGAQTHSRAQEAKGNTLRVAEESLPVG